jgi:hypothetical protein
MRTISIIILLLLLTFACKKTSLKDNCENLKQAILSNNREMAKTAVNNIIMTLPDQNYTESNLQSLINKLNTDCHLTAEMLCYSCLYSNPPQSVIRISVSSPVSSLGMSISYIPTTNRMTSVH